MISAPDDSPVREEDIRHYYNANTWCASLCWRLTSVGWHRIHRKRNATGAAQAQLQLLVLTRTFAYLDGYSRSKKQKPSRLAAV